MLEFIKKILSTKPSTHNSSAINNNNIFNISEPQLLLLAEFIKAKSRKKIEPGWEKLLAEPPEKTLDRLICNGLLIQGKLEVRLGDTYNIGTLKSLLKERRQAISGKKEILIQRLIDADPEGMRVLVNDIYECSTVARDLIERYKSEKEIEKDKVVNEVLGHFQSKNIKKACHIATSYQDQIVCPPRKYHELTIKPSYETIIGFVGTILSANPKILGGMARHDLKCLRESTALFFLFGPNKASESLLESFVGIPRFNKENTKKMMLCFAYRQTSLMRAKKAGIKKASVITTGCPCEACRAIVDKLMPLDKLPELPYSGCTKDDGCRCRLKFEI